MTATTTRTPLAAPARLAGYTAIGGALAMFLGALLWAASGADLDAALEDGTIADYLVEAAGHTTLLTTNLGFWILGVLLMGVGGLLLTRLGDADSAAGTVARFAFTAGPAAAIVFFCIWMGIVLGLAPAHAAGEPVIGVAVALGQAATVADWIATALIVGVGVAAVATAGRHTWVPRWLFAWAMVALAAGAVAVLGLVLGSRTTLAMAIVPVGLGWMVAAGITAVRRGA